MAINLLDKLEQDALRFMDKRLSIENSLKRDLENVIMRIFEEIKNYLKSLSSVSLTYLSYVVKNDMRNIIENHKINYQSVMEDAINNNFETGINQASKFLQDTEEQFNPIIVEQDKNQEVLAALLLFGRNLANGLFDDLATNLDRELVSAFIINKSDIPSVNNANRNTDNNSTLSLVLSGVLLSKYIIKPFKNITDRSNTISQTESNRALNHGVLLMYISAKKEIQELKVKWVEVKDQKLCKHCRDRANGGDDGDGVYSIGEVQPPPLHPNCRCILIPFLYKWFI